MCFSTGSGPLTPGLLTLLTVFSFQYLSDMSVMRSGFHVAIRSINVDVGPVIAVCNISNLCYKLP